MDFVCSSSVEEDLLLSGGERPESPAHGYLLRAADLLEDLVVIPGPGALPAMGPGGHRVGPGAEGALGHGEGGVGDHQVHVDYGIDPQAVAAGTSAVGRVEGEEAGLELAEARAALGAGVALGIEGGFPALRLDLHQAAGFLEGDLHGVAEPLPFRVLGGHLVDEELDEVLVVALELGDGVQLVERPVDANLGEARAPQAREELLVGPLAAADQGRVDRHALARALAQDLADDGGGGAALDAFSTARAMRDPDPSEEKAQMVVDLGHRGHRRAGVARGVALLDGDGRGEAFDEVHVRLVHELQELPRVGGKALDVAPLPLGVEGVEGQGGFSGAREPREYAHAAPGEQQVDALEICADGLPPPDHAAHRRAPRRRGRCPSSGPTARGPR